MGLLNKIKNVLFEEEEVEIPVEETVPEVKKPEKKVEKKRNTFEEEVKPKPKESTYPDHELFKAEKTFDFPVFDDQEFEQMNHKQEEHKEEKKENLSINLFDHENPRAKKELKRPKTEEIKGRAYDNKASDFDKRKFKPSPVISPVYGVLDKNYKKEDIVVIKQEAKKSYDVEEVRKKAFGTLEVDMEKNKHATSKKEEKPLEEKSIDELLEETAFDTIELPDFKEDNEFSDDYEEENVDISLEELDKRKKMNQEKQEPEDDALENDLFDLIDSMYENKEDE